MQQPKETEREREDLTAAAMLLLRLQGEINAEFERGGWTPGNQRGFYLLARAGVRLCERYYNLTGEDHAREV
jgi:hypothetical protein